MLALFHYISLLMAGTSAILYGVRGVHSPSSGFGFTTKLVAILGLLIFAAFADAPPLLLVALFCAMIGDICLTQTGDRWLLGGMGAFGLAHVFYCILFFQIGESIALLPLVISLGIGAAAYLFLRRRAERALRPPLLGYICVIAIMLGLAVPIGELVLIAAVLFAVSDFVLGTQLFRPQRVFPTLQTYVVWAFYWLAQLGFVAAFTL